MNKDKKLKEEVEQKKKYYDDVILKVVSGVDFGFWSKLIDLIMTSTEIEYNKYKKDYPDLLDAIDRYNKAHRKIGFSSKLQRRGM